jgi:serine phosphatase RsbU (regulator of sigma subunit)
VTTRPGPGLDRLLGRDALERLLAALEAAAPGSNPRIVDPAGRIVGNAEAHHSATAPTHELPIAASGESFGTLVVDGVAEDAPAALTAQALAMAAEQALNVRFLAAETLERYRELNVLYEVGERIAGSLDPVAIVSAALAECRRVVGAGAAVAVLPDGETDRRVIPAHEMTADAVEALLIAGDALLYRVATSGVADLEAEPPAGEAVFGSLLAVPIRGDGVVLGSMLLARAVGRPVFTAGDEKVVGAVAAQVAVALQNASLHHRELEARRMEEELAVGRRIQLGLLPLEAPQPDGWQIAAVYRAARQVGGDFYDFVEGPAGSPLLGLIVGDVAGKGVPAALMMAYARAVLRSSSLAGSDPAEVLGHANDTMLGECRRAALLVSVFHGSLDTTTGRLRYASAGHDWPLIRRADGSVEFLSSSGTMLGLLDRGEFEDRVTTLEAGDVLAIYTDGITEARSTTGELFGEERLVGALAGAPVDDGAAAVLEAIVAAVDAFGAGAQPADDLTLVVIRRAA